MATTKIGNSELILNPDGSVYHLHLLPEDIAETILLVGDPDRVKKVSKHFDRIEIKKQKREFITHTGYIGKKRLTVLSTGIGTDNIDIVLNELDALVNVNLKSRTINAKKKPLRLVRLGTSGALQKDIAVDSYVVSSHGLGLDGLLNYYQLKYTKSEQALLDAFNTYFHDAHLFPKTYMAKGNAALIKLLGAQHTTGITATCSGFYGPQGRSVRAKLHQPDLIETLAAFTHKKERITNFEMETSAIYGLAAVLGHEACSVNAIIANRPNKQFSTQPDKAVERMIKEVLEKLSK